MNRSTFFKSLVGIAITPFVVKEIVEAKPKAVQPSNPFPKRSLSCPNMFYGKLEENYGGTPPVLYATDPTGEFRFNDVFHVFNSDYVVVGIEGDRLRCLRVDINRVNINNSINLEN